MRALLIPVVGIALIGCGQQVVSESDFHTKPPTRISNEELLKKLNQDGRQHHIAGTGGNFTGGTGGNALPTNTTAPGT